jgi:hypothetical protein
VSYLEFTAPELAERATSFLANVSGCFALFELTGGGLLRAVELRRLDRYDDDLVTIQKYPGQTVESCGSSCLRLAFAVQASPSLGRSAIPCTPGPLLMTKTSQRVG